MKTFRLISAALLAVLMCANFASCSKDDDAANTDVGGNDEGGNQEVIVSEKKLVKMVGTLSYDSDTYNYTYNYTFSYDNEGRLSSAIDTNDDGDKYSYKFIWGDDAVVVKYEHTGGYGSDYTETYTYTLKDGLVQNYITDSNNGTYYYNSSNSLIKAEFTGKGYTINAVWNKDKLVSVRHSYANYGSGTPSILTYGETTCKKGYFPLISDIIGWEDLLFIAHPEIAGMRTNQLPNTYSYADYEEFSLTYEYDKEGYISKIKMKNEDGDSETYTLTWK